MSAWADYFGFEAGARNLKWLASALTPTPGTETLNI